MSKPIIIHTHSEKELQALQAYQRENPEGFQAFAEMLEAHQQGLNLNPQQARKLAREREAEIRENNQRLGLAMFRNFPFFFPLSDK